jgi:hypothetical protein
MFDYLCSELLFVVHHRKEKFAVTVYSTVLLRKSTLQLICNISVDSHKVRNTVQSFHGPTRVLQVNKYKSFASVLVNT